jgi:hypothetical protein
MVHFWGNDSALEISFFVDTGALEIFAPQSGGMEEEYLTTFDAALDRIHAVARKKYSRNRSDAYFLSAEDF